MIGHTLVKKLVPPYEVLRTLYNGTSEVRLYRNTVTGAHRVGKRIDLLGLDESVSVNEATTLEAIEHPNIVPIFDVLAVEGYENPMNVIEIVMPYFPRGSVVDAFAEKERFSLREACRHVQAGLMGLQHLHEVQGILHRDVKSGNLILSDDGSRLKVGDLGVATKMDPQGRVPAFPGAHPYIAPETYIQATIGREADLYGIGLVLLEMASKALPYDEYTIDLIANRLERGRRGPRPKDLRYEPQVPRQLRSLINKSIKEDPANRFHSAVGMSRALARIRLIDWSAVVDDDNNKIWEGEAIQRPDRMYRVEATRKKSAAAWRLSGLQRVTSSWRRVCADSVLADLHSEPAFAFFESMLVLATKR